LFDSFVQFRSTSNPVEAKPVRHILVHGLRERIGFLEDHAYAFAEFDHIEVWTVKLLAGDSNRPLDAHPLDQVIHTIEAPEQGGFSATGRTDESGDDMGADA
jgi:hypothetical protein